MPNVTKTGWTKLREKWDEDPIQVLVVGSLAATAAAKLIDSMSAAQGRRAYARDVDTRAKMRGL